MYRNYGNQIIKFSKRLDEEKNKIRVLLFLFKYITMFKTEILEIFDVHR